MIRQTSRYARTALRLWTRRLPALGLATLGASLLLVGCGGAGAGATSGGGTSSLSSAQLTGTVTVNQLPTRSANAPTATPTAAAGSTTAPATPDATSTSSDMVIVTPSNAGSTTAVKVGQLVQAQLPYDRNWVYIGQSGVTLAPTAPSGSHTSDGLYLWTFRAETAGDATLHFTGKTTCQANVPCTPLAFTLNFALRVTA